MLGLRPQVAPEEGSGQVGLEAPICASVVVAVGDGSPPPSVLPLGTGAVAYTRPLYDGTSSRLGSAGFTLPHVIGVANSTATGGTVTASSAVLVVGSLGLRNGEEEVTRAEVVAQALTRRW